MHVKGPSKDKDLEAGPLGSKSPCPHYLTRGWPEASDSLLAE
jgi:hypothetical protein